MTATTNASPVDIQAQISERFPSAKPRSSLDLPAIDIPAAELASLMGWLRDTAGFDMLVDVSGIDWDRRSPRFEVAYHLYSTQGHRYLRVVCACAEDASPSVPTVEGIWPGANWHERETYDMFGIRFQGHSDLRRILMWDEYPHFPLRKEFPLAGIDVPLPGADVAAETGVSAKPAPMMGGPFVAAQASGQMSEAEPRAKDESWTERREKPST